MGGGRRGGCAVPGGKRPEELRRASAGPSPPLPPMRNDLRRPGPVFSEFYPTACLAGVPLALYPGWMELYVTDPLFAWARLEDHPQLETLCQLLRSLPDADLLAGLRQARGKGRDDYPVERLWGVVVCTIALRHTSFEARLAER